MLVNQVLKNQFFEGFLLVRSSEQRTSSNGGKYLDMTLCDISGEVNAKMWDGTAAAPAAGSVIKVRALMQEYNGHNQLRVDKMRPAGENDAYDMSALVPSAPRSGEDMRAEIDRRVDAMADETLKRIVRYRLNECGEKLAYYPAATKLHHAERGGLLHHTSTMLRMADAVCTVYPQLDTDLLAAGVILHDLCKIDEIKADSTGIAAEYTRAGQLLGHITLGISALDRACEALNVRGETRLLLEHMLLSHHDLPEFGSPKPPMFPEAEVLHLLDLLDARMFEMTRALEQVKPGSFTDRIWSLDRRLYRRRDAAKPAPEEESPAK
ncbi:MAG: HD domain-containing protein [Clostridia bacterium]|nr:HD domain-containing protein [Clostridia bacterium]